MANLERGEVSIVLDGEARVMRPTFQALCEIEAGTGQKFVPLAASFSQGRIGVTDLAVIVASGLKAGGLADAKVPKVGEMLVRAGIWTDSVIIPVRQFFHNALNGGSEPGEAKAAEPANS
jgi:hypothetical protein